MPSGQENGGWRELIRGPHRPLGLIVDGDQALPGREVASSRGLGWRTTQARILEEAVTVEEFTTTPAPGFLVAMKLSGPAQRVEHREGSRWISSLYRPGLAGLELPGHADTVRWRGKDTHSRGHTLYVYLSPDLLGTTSHDFGLGDDPARTMPRGPAVEDPMLERIGQAIATAVGLGVDALCADSLAMAMATRLLRIGPSPKHAGATRVTSLGDSTARLVTDYMSAHLAEPITLDELSSLVSISKYHFVRSFSRAVGETPYRFLTRLRIEHAAQLLHTTDDTVEQVMTACGYRSRAQFNTAFRRRFGCLPLEYRRQN